MDNRWKSKIKYLAEIFKDQQQKGSVIIIAMGALFVLLLLGSYFLSFASTEYRISRSQIQSLQTYYLAEAGINETVWRLKNDTSWSTCFTSSTASCNCINWATSSYRNAGSLLPNAGYIMSVKNSGCGNSEFSVQATRLPPDESRDAPPGRRHDAGGPHSRLKVRGLRHRNQGLRGLDLR